MQRTSCCTREVWVSHSMQESCCLQAEQVAADLAERQRLQQLAVEVKQFNALKLMELSERDREER